MPDDPLLPAAEAVADGQPVDWGGVESSSPTQDLEPLRQLKIIEQIASLHRQLGPAASTGEPLRSAPESPAFKWGPLDVLEKVGGGSFGDVYRAWDTTLAREVALKLVRRTAGMESAAREGQLLAKIAHPNVMKVYGAQQIDAQFGVWSEFLRGRTLQQIVQSDGPFSWEETLVVGDAVCRALASAHRAGLLHRDVKAQNVMRETGGRIVLMDFGLGRDTSAAAAEGSMELAGTPLYLAPELFEGTRASARTDLYSLGVLLFYMVTGTFPVMADSLQGIRDAHRTQARTKLQDLRPDLPNVFVQLLDRALEHDPDKRFATAGEMQTALAFAANPVNRTQTVSAAQAFRTPAVRVAIAALVVAIVVVAALAGWLAPRPEAPRAAVHLSIEPPPGWRFSDSTRNIPAMAPDGRSIALVAADNTSGRIHLWIHSLATGEYRQLPNSERGLTPFWAPDGKRLAFFMPDGTLQVATAEGIVARSIATSQEPRGGTWNRNGVVLFPKGPRGGIFKISVDDPSGRDAIVIAPDRARGELGYIWPQFLDDDDHFIFYVLSNDARVRGIYLSSLSQPTATMLTAADASGSVAGQELFYVKDGTLVVQQMQGTQLRGAATTLMADVEVSHDSRSAVTVAPDGTIAYVPATDQTELVWFNRDGTEGSPVAIPKGRYRSPAISIDDRLIAVQRYRDGLSEVQVFDAATGAARPSLAHSAEVQFPVWGAAHQLAYAATVDGRSTIYVKDFDLDEAPRQLTGAPRDTPDSDLMPTDWTRDGSHLLFVNFTSDRPYSLWALPAGGAPFAMRPGEGAQVSGRVSPDGKKLVYVRRVPAERTGDRPERELWVCDFPSGKNPRLLAQGGIDPNWPSNTEVSYFDRAARLTIQQLAGPILARFATGVSTPEASRNNYAWTADGQRLLVNRPVTDPAQVRVGVIVDGLRSARSPIAQ